MLSCIHLWLSNSNDVFWWSPPHVCSAIFLIETLFVCVSALRKTHHIKDDQNTVGKHVRKAGKCDRAVTPSVSLSLTVCISLAHYTLCFSLSPFLSLFFLNISYQLKECLHLLCTFDRRRVSAWKALLFLGTKVHWILIKPLECDNLVWTQKKV